MSISSDESHDSALPVASGWALLAVAASALPLRNWDYWFHAHAGALIEFHRAIPDTNLFGFAAPRDTPLLLTTWLGDVWLHRLHDMGGLVAALAARNLCFLAAWAGLAWCMWKLTQGHGRAVGLGSVVGGLSFLAVSGFAGPQMFAWPIFAALCVIFVLSLERRGARLLMPILAGVSAAVWANVALGFWVPAATCLVFAAVARHRSVPFKPYLFAAAISGAAIFTTPVGAAILPAALDGTGLEAWLLMGAMVGLVPAMTRLPRAAHALPRFVVVLGTLILVATGFAVQPWTDDHAQVPAALFGDRVRQSDPLRGYGPSNTPVEAVEFLRTRGGQPRVLAAPHLSGYLLFELQEARTPQPIVWGIPDRAREAAVTVPRSKLTGDPEVMRGVLHQLDVEAIIVTPELATIGAQLDAVPQWQLIGTWPSAKLYILDPTR